MKAKNNATTEKNVNKYWENEEADITSTANAELRLFIDAGKLQIYPKYASEDSEVKDKIGRGCVWDMRDMDAVEAMELVAQIANAFRNTLDKNGEYYEEFNNMVFDVFKVRKTIIDAIRAKEAEENNDDADGYDAMSVEQLKALCKERGIKINSRTKTAKIVELLEEYDAQNPTEEDFENIEENLDEVLDSEFKDEDEVVAEDNNVLKISYSGTWLAMDESGKVTAVKQKSKKANADAAEWLEYFEACISEMEEMVANSLNKNGKNKGKLNDSKFDKMLGAWVKDFDADAETERKINEFCVGWHNDIRGVVLKDGDIGLTGARKCELVTIVDNF